MATTATPSTALATIPVGSYVALNQDQAETKEMLEVMAENLGGETLTARHLTRIGMPAAGGLAWEMPDGDGDVEMVRTLKGIIVHFERTHSYWPPEQDSGTPPACSSVGMSNTAIGVGTPGGPCKTCPHNEFGTKIRPDGREAKGKACTERENWFLLVENQPLPIVVSLSPGSLNAANDYRVKTLGSQGKRLTSVVTEIGLTNSTNDTGEKFSYIVPRVAGKLTAEEAAKAREYAIGLRPVFAAAAVEDASGVVDTASDIDADSEEM